MHRRQRCVEAFAVARRQAVVGIDRRFPVHGIQVRYLHGAAGRFEAGDGEVLEGTIERLRFGMGVDDQDIHGGLSTRGSAQLRSASGILEMNFHNCRYYES
jgi:hypothetical protein